jgi:hypothetical protein
MENKWIDINHEEPQIHSTIEFKTSDGAIYPGTYLNYNQFKSIDGEIIEIDEIEKWRIREYKTNIKWINQNNLRYRSRIINILQKFDAGHYWQASSSKGSSSLSENGESQKEAIQKLKSKIDQEEK